MSKMKEAFMDVMKAENVRREENGTKAVWAYMDDHYQHAARQAQQGIDGGAYDAAAIDLIVDVLHSLASIDGPALAREDVAKLYARAWTYFLNEQVL